MLNRQLIKKLLLATSIIAIILITSIFLISVYIPSLPAQSPRIRLSVQKVLISQLVSNVDGSYWENELWKQAEIIKHLPLSDRLDFYLLILLNCELNDSRAYMFTEIVGKDALQFQTHLISYRDNKENKKSGLNKKAIIDSWVYEMGVVAKQNIWNK